MVVHRKPVGIHWKADAPKTSHCLVRILVQRHKWGNFSLKMSKKRPLQSMAIISGPCWTNFCSQKFKRRILAAFGFNRTALRATQPKLHSMFCALFLKITLSAAELMSFGHLGAKIWHRWTIICEVPSKCYADKSETIDTLKDNIRETIGGRSCRLLGGPCIYSKKSLLTPQWFLSN